MADSNIHNEKGLLLKIAEGDEQAFKQLYIQLRPMLFGFIFKLTKSEEAVKEIVQESLYRLWMSRDKRLTERLMHEIEHSQEQLTVVFNLSAIPAYILVTCTRNYNQTATCLYPLGYNMVPFYLNYT